MIETGDNWELDVECDMPPGVGFFRAENQDGSGFLGTVSGATGSVGDPPGNAELDVERDIAPGSR